ncbi:MAG: hypothetical protein JWM00_641 [Candidatus Saccharibacteria bacterium]|nr:hypothetical protein [Candidatus Saccharibacteria bacterium]
MVSEVDNEVERDQDKDRPSFARYDLDAEELEQIEHKMVGYVEKRVAEQGIAILWVSPSHNFSNFIRTHEAHYFPEVAEVSDEDESNTLFLALIDTRDDSRRVVHGATVMYPKFMQNGVSRSERAEQDGIETTGFYTIDSLIERGNFTADEFTQYYTDKGMDLSKCLSVETNFRIGERPDDFSGLKPADITYVALYERLMSTTPPLLGAAIFATINDKQIQSFERVGLKYEPIMGKTDLNTEESELGIKSLPVALIYDQYAYDLMSTMSKEVAHLSVE